LDAVKFELSQIEKEIQRYNDEPHKFKGAYAMSICDICGKMEDFGNHI
jgi:hypothetical protein